MALRMTVGTRNIRALAANFSAADARVQRSARQLVAKYAEKQFRLTRELAPVDTGFLRSHIRKRVSDDGLAYEVGVREEDFADAGKAFYAQFLEFGTRFMSARPFIFPARDAVVPEFRRALGTELSASVRRRSR
jgi:HK97 gp10 family phage protein